MDTTRRIRTIAHSVNAGAVLVRRQPDRNRSLAVWKDNACVAAHSVRHALLLRDGRR